MNSDWSFFDSLDRDDDHVVIEPPKVLNVSVSFSPQVSKTIEWLKENGNKHRGMWVAIKDGELVGESEKRSVVKTLLDSVPDGDNAIVVKIPSVHVKF